MALAVSEMTGSGATLTGAELAERADTTTQHFSELVVAGLLAPRSRSIGTSLYRARPLCYTLGQHEILRWGLAAAEVADPGSSLPDSHDRLHALGSLPLPTIDRELTRRVPRTQ
jgi:hypothetical protein